MPFTTGEFVDWIPRRYPPDTTSFHVEGADFPLSVANGGLVQRRKGLLHPVFRAPGAPGKYRLEWRVAGETVRVEHIRVQAPAPPRDEPPPNTSLALEGVRARRL